MSLSGIGEIVGVVSRTIDDLHTSDEERSQVALKEHELEASLIKGQLDPKEAWYLR